MAVKKYNLSFVLPAAQHQISQLLSAQGVQLGGASKASVLSFASVLRDLRLVMALQVSPARTQAMLDLRPKLAAGSKALGIDPKLVQLSDHLAVADWFLNLAERVDYAAYSRPELLLKRVGLRWVYGGEGFELLTHGHRGLQKKLDSLGVEGRNSLNTLVAQGSKDLVDARGQRVNGLAGRFGEVRTALDIWIHQPGGRKVKFVDTARIAYFEPANNAIDSLYIGLLAGAEIKLPGAARAVGPQIARIEDRFKRALAIELTVPGQFQSAVFFPEQILFNKIRTDYSAITAGDIPGMTPRSRTTTTPSGKDLKFDQYHIDVDVRELMYMIDLLFTI